MQVKVLVVNSGEENNLELKLTQMFQNIKKIFLKNFAFSVPWRDTKFTQSSQ